MLNVLQRQTDKDKNIKFNTKLITKTCPKRLNYQ